MSGSVSALVPNLSLGATGGLPQAGGAAPLNPFDMLSKVAQLRQSQNQNQQFQQTMAARQRAGEIISAAPDPETGLAAASKDPLVAAFAPDVLASYRATQQVMESTQGTIGKNNQDALGSVLRAAAGSAQNPQQLDKLLSAQLAAVPDTIRSRIMPAVQQFRSALTDGLPQDGGQTFRTRLTGMMVGSGMNSDSIHSAMGTPGLTDTGQVLQPTLTPADGGPVRPNGPALGKGIAPQVLDTEGAGGQKQKTVFGGVAAPGQGNALGVPQGVPNAPGAQSAPTPPANPLGVPNAPRLAPGVISSGPTPGQVTAQQKGSDLDNEVESSVVQGGAALQKNVKDINIAIDSLGKFQSGGGTGARQALGQFAEAMKNLGVPITQAQIDSISSGSLEGAELYKKIMSGVSLRQLGNNTMGQGHTFAPEVNQALANFSSDVTPDALVKLLSSVKQGYQADFDRSLKLPLYREMLKARDNGVDVPGLPAGYQMRDYNTWYNNQYNPKNLPENNAGGGMNLGPVNPAEVKGSKENLAASQVPMYVRGSDGKAMRNPAYK